MEDLQSSKVEKWKASSQPLHEWLDGIEDDAKEFDAIGGNIADVESQLDELQVSFGEDTYHTSIPSHPPYTVHRTFIT